MSVYGQSCRISGVHIRTWPGVSVETLMLLGMRVKEGGLALGVTKKMK